MVKNSPATAENSRDTGLIPGLGRSLAEGNGNPLQYFCLANPMDRGDWQATYSSWGLKSWTRLSKLNHQRISYIFPVKPRMHNRSSTFNFWTNEKVTDSLDIF